MKGRSIQSLYDGWESLDQEKFDSLLVDFERFCAEGSYINNKSAQPVEFILNEAQRETASLVLGELFSPLPRPTNLVIHKSRQMGATVLFLKLEQFIATRIKDFRIIHFMPTDKDVKDIKDFKFVPLLQGTHPDLLPLTYETTNRVKFLEFHGCHLGSTVDFKTSQSQGSNHGQTNNMIILDEYAKYLRVFSFERGVLATVPKVGRSLIVYVSTAMGENHFKDVCDQAIADPEHWKYLFLPWHMLKEYEMDPSPDSRLGKLESLTQYEMTLLDIFEAKGYPKSSWVRKLAWYDYTFKTEAKSDVRFMHDNYPSTAEESFAASGNTALPISVLSRWAKDKKAFDFVELMQEGAAYTLEKVEVSTIKRFKRPTVGHKYIIGADPSDGIDDGDPSCAVVVDLSTMEAVCSIVERIEQTEFAEVLAMLGKVYNTAEIVVETNKGMTVVEWLKMYGYPNIYIDHTKTTSVRVSYGLYMTRPVKNEAIRRMRFLMNNSIYTDFDQDFISEAKAFVWNKTPSGMAKAEAAGKGHDDQVMARLIAIATISMNRWKEYKTYGKEKQTRTI